MKTKLTLDEETRKVLETQLEVSGNEVRITGQLDRKLYVKVNKVLESLDGQWNRKRKAHEFSKNPEDELNQIIDTGEYDKANAFSFFPTPSNVIDEYVLPYFKKVFIDRGDLNILEPSAGEGDLALPVFEYLCKTQGKGVNLTLVEKDPKRLKVLREKVGNSRIVEEDFLSYSPGEVFDIIVMNPPFSSPGKPLEWAEHVLKAYSLLEEDGLLIAILPSSVKFRTHKLAQDVRDLCEDIVDLPQGAFKASGTGVNTVMVGIRK